MSIRQQQPNAAYVFRMSLHLLATEIQRHLFVYSLSSVLSRLELYAFEMFVKHSACEAYMYENEILEQSTLCKRSTQLAMPYLLLSFSPLLCLSLRWNLRAPVYAYYVFGFCVRLLAFGGLSLWRLRTA